jgi:hypothetical protein
MDAAIALSLALSRCEAVKPAAEPLITVDVGPGRPTVTVVSVREALGDHRIRWRRRGRFVSLDTRMVWWEYASCLLPWVGSSYVAWLPMLPRPTISRGDDQ